MLYRFRGLWWRMELIMPLVHRHQQIPRQRTTNLSRAIILGILLLATLNSSWAQDTGVVTTGKPNPLYTNSGFHYDFAAHFCRLTGRVLILDQ